MRVLRHALAICLLPGTVVVLVPALIVLAVGARLRRAGICRTGLLSCLSCSARRFSRSALPRRLDDRALRTRGPRHARAMGSDSTLVVEGPYRHVRNPMISGVLFLLLGEAALLGSLGAPRLVRGRRAVNAIYMPLVEEPGLVRRYGAAYERYRAAVPAGSRCLVPGGRRRRTRLSRRRRRRSAARASPRRPAGSPPRAARRARALRARPRTAVARPPRASRAGRAPA